VDPKLRELAAEDHPAFDVLAHKAEPRWPA